MNKQHFYAHYVFIFWQLCSSDLIRDIRWIIFEPIVCYKYLNNSKSTDKIIPKSYKNINIVMLINKMQSSRHGSVVNKSD